MIRSLAFCLFLVACGGGDLPPGPDAPADAQPLLDASCGGLMEPCCGGGCEDGLECRQAAAAPVGECLPTYDAD